MSDSAVSLAQQTPRAPQRAGQGLPEQWNSADLEQIDAPEGSWSWMVQMAILAPVIRARLGPQSAFPDAQELSPRTLPIGANLHHDLIEYESRLVEEDAWSRRYLTVLEQGESPATAHVAMRERRTTSWRRQRARSERC